MARKADPNTHNVMCRGCKDVFHKDDHELNYEGYCSLCVCCSTGKTGKGRDMR